ncbi:MAG: hypothetical protein AAF215_29790 [Cyanobacteria bacterium P01_A01_bin.123]
MTSIHRDEFLYKKAGYQGKFTPDSLLFNHNLQEFSQRVGYIANLQTAGKLSSEESFQQIQTLWKTLKQTKKTLRPDI